MIRHRRAMAWAGDRDVFYPGLSAAFRKKESDVRIVVSVEYGNRKKAYREEDGLI